jgi:hypothetical protein
MCQPIAQDTDAAPTADYLHTPEISHTNRKHVETLVQRSISPD